MKKNYIKLKNNNGDKYKNIYNCFIANLKPTRYVHLQAKYASQI